MIQFWSYKNYQKWLLSYSQTWNILDFDVVWFYQDMIEKYGIQEFFKKDDKINWPSMHIIDEINFVLPDQFPKIDMIYDSSVWRQYLNHAQSIKTYFEELTKKADYQERKEQWEENNTMFKRVWLDYVIWTLKVYRDNLTIKIQELEQQEQTHIAIQEESKKYSRNIWNIFSHTS